MRLKTSLMIPVTLTLLAAAAPVSAQWRAEPILPVRQAPSVSVVPPALLLPDSLQSRPDHAATLAMIGAANAVIGSLGGAYMGYQLDRNHFNWGCEYGCEDPGLTGLLGGWFLGSALTTPLSVHYANGGRGSLPAAYLSSALIAGAGMAGFLAAGSPGGTLFVLGAPVAQVISAVLIERRSAR